jgi:zona occludens toxin (predicted ATPase)
MIIIYLGRRGSGKTLSMVKDAYIEYKRGRKIISNIEGIPFASYMSNQDILAIDKNSNIKNAVILIDEAQIFFDSRRSMKKENISFSNFVQQIRKRDIILLLTTQFANAVEKRLRDHADIIAKVQFIHGVNLCRVKYIDLTSIEDEFSQNYDNVEVIYDASKIFKLYDTNQMIV